VLRSEAVLGRSWWQPIALGTVLILVGLFVLRDALAAKVLSAIAFGIALLAAGISEIAESFLAPHWRGLVWRLLVGALYAFGGAVLLADPVAGSVILALVFALAMFASGAVRIHLAVQDWRLLNLLLLASGMVGVLAGVVLVAKWPLDGLRAFGLLVGLDLVLHGTWWALLGWTMRHEPRQERASAWQDGALGR
jgi:uncharacterized membrane protein HdeD (DUF308 family)